MNTKHYLVTNLEEFSAYIGKVDNLKRYLDDVESIFPIIEKIFGREWRDGYINIILDDSKGGASYRRLRGVHTIKIGINNKGIQTKKYPENLWGCLLHETLHAFMDPIIHREDSSTNDLDEYYWDRHKKEPFICAFQALVYLRLKENSILDETLCKNFLSKLESELSEKFIIDLYKRYLNMFLKDPDNFNKFIKRLESSSLSLFRKDSFWQDLDEAEEALSEGR